MNEKTRGELFAECRDMGITATVSDTKEDLIAKLEGRYRKKQADAPMIPEGQLLTLQGEKVDGKKYRVTIFSTETDKSDVSMSVNGYGIRMKRDQEYILDECFVTEALGHSVIQTTEQDPDTMTSRPVKRMTYPHQAIPV